MRTSENPAGSSPHPDFELVHEEWNEEIQAKVRLFRHGKTGAEVLSVCNEESNKVFAITLRTPTHDSTGVAHILEHTVLCGSERFPVKDPFKELMKGSLYTFLNAMTYSDKTIYPVASENLKDFHNLTDIYLDAVYFPQLSKQMFEQEGWHHELLSESDALQFKGVVFNEMKGVYSSPDSEVYRALNKSLLPDCNESEDSGGTPAFIPDLSHEALRDYHRRYYHPSNSRIFFYGDDDEAERLERLAPVLNRFEAAPVDSSIRLQVPFAEPIEVQHHYMPSEDANEASSYALAGWMLSESNDPVRNASLNLLGYLLLGQTGSPLRKALVESELGEDLAGYGMDASGVQIDFTTGLRGVRAENVPKVFEMIRVTLERLEVEGFSENAIEAAFNTTEFHLRENNTGSSPRGLVLMLRVMNQWLQDKSPFAMLRVREIIDEIQARRAADPAYFQSLLRSALLDNPHRLHLRVDPDTGIAARQLAAERNRLEQVRAGWSAEELQACIQRSKELIALQDTPDDPAAVATIPRLNKSDLRREIRDVPQEIDERDDMICVHNQLLTRDIWYLDLAFDASAVPTHLLPYLPLFGRSLTEMGTAKLSYVALSEQIGMKTGGISTTCYTGSERHTGRTQARLLIRAKVLREKADDLLGLLEDMLLHLRFDPQRFRQMVMEEKSYEESGMVPAGHRLARTRLQARFSEADWISELIDGFHYVEWLRRMQDRVSADWDSVEAELQTLHRLLINRHRLAINNTIEDAGFAKVQPALDAFLQRLPADAPEAADWQRATFPQHEALVAPAQINYVGQLVELDGLDWTFSGAHLVINRHIRNSWLWDEVRVKGGAYGAGSSINRDLKTMLFTSYRDPNIAETLQAYRDTAHFLQHPPTDEAVEQAIIGTIGEVDNYRLPDARGYSAFIRQLLGIQSAERQQTRDEILATRPEDFANFGRQLEAAFEDTHTVIVGREDRIRAESLPDSLVITPLFPATS